MGVYQLTVKSHFDAAHRLYDLALTYQERSQIAEANLLEQFETAVPDPTWSIACAALLRGRCDPGQA